MRITRNNTVGMKGAYGTAGANAGFRRHRLLSLPALEDLAGGVRGAVIGTTRAEGKTSVSMERTQKPIMFKLFMQRHGIHELFQREREREKKSFERSKSCNISDLPKIGGIFCIPALQLQATHTRTNTWKEAQVHWGVKPCNAN